MNFKRYPILILIGVLVFFSLACSFQVNLPETKVIDPQVETIAEAYPETGTAKLAIQISGGEVNFGPGAGNLVEGTVTYNIEDLRPDVSRSGSSVKITQGAPKISITRDRVKNEWDMRLGNDPMELDLKIGAYDGTLDFSGVPLQRLAVTEGASKGTVVFNTPNPVRMDELSYTSGASNLTISGLLNANFDVMNFKGGAGNFTLDFGGNITADTRVNLDAGVGNFTITIPRDANAEVNLSGGMSNVSTEGTWTIDGKQYRTIGTSGPLLKIDVLMGIGNLKLVLE